MRSFTKSICFTGNRMMQNGRSLGSLESGKLFFSVKTTCPVTRLHRHVGFFGHQTIPKYLAGLHFGYRLEIVKTDSWCEGQMKLPTGWLSSFRSRVLLWAIGCLLLIPHSVFAQEVASYDYTNAKHSDRLHPPLPPPSPKRLPNGMLAVASVLAPGQRARTRRNRDSR